MRILASLVLLIPLAAQEPPVTPTTPPAAPVTAPAAAPSAPAATPPAAVENSAGDGWLKGSIDVGYRWIPNIDGNANAYRSVVNLGEGPKLIDADFTLTDPKKRVFDRADVHASSWGGDPYNTLRVDVDREGWYRLTADYRNIAYFNFLPSFANPQLSLGSLLDQNSFDTKIRSSDVHLDLLPRKWITPYLAYGRNSQDGRGITIFQTDRNQYPVANVFTDRTDNYRGGARMEMGRFHVTLEQGGTTYREDQGVSDAGTVPGNFTGFFLGTQLPLKSLQELYRVRGDSIYSKALLAANPYSWMSVSGQFIYAQPHSSINYTESSTGTFYLQNILQFYSSGQDLASGSASMPHVSGNISLEIRPLRRLRVVEHWMTDRLHNAANSLLAESFLVAGVPLTDKQLADDHLVLNYNTEEVDAYFDVTSKLTLRGGYRFVWGNADTRAPLLTGLDLESANLRRHVGIAGVNYRVGQKFRVTADAEGSSANQTFFRTSLQDYQKMHVRARYDLTANLRLSADFSLLNNSDPDPNVKLDFSNKIESASIYWTPKGGKWANVLVDYSRTAIRSSILYLIPQILSPTTSAYRENAHSFTMVTGVKWLSFGGSMFLSEGTRPTNYFQPMARVTVPLRKHVQWISEWRWYSMSEELYAYENFRSNQFLTSLRFTR